MHIEFKFWPLTYCLKAINFGLCRITVAGMKKPRLDQTGFFRTKYMRVSRRG